LHETFTEMGHEPWTLEEVRQRVKHSARNAFPALFGDDWERAANRYRDAYRSKNLERLLPLPGAEEVLKQLQAQGVYMAIVSNKMGDTLRREAEHLGWNHYFSALVGSTDSEHDKPHPAPVYLALGELVPSEEIWFIGDTPVDLEVAQRAGLTPILYGPVTPDADRSDHHGGFPFARHFTQHDSLLEALTCLLQAQGRG